MIHLALYLLLVAALCAGGSCSFAGLNGRIPSPTGAPAARRAVSVHPACAAAAPSSVRIPMINSFVMAFQNYKLTRPNAIHFNGLENFRKLFADSDMGLIMKNSLIYVVASVAGRFLLGMTLALALRKKFRGRGLYQAAVFLPWAFSAFVIGLIYRWSFNGEYGVVNDLMQKLGWMGEKIAWLGTPGLSLLVVILAMIWMGVPFLRS
jgi:multiple sugar transport system permease protein